MNTNDRVQDPLSKVELLSKIQGRVGKLGFHFVPHFFHDFAAQFYKKIDDEIFLILAIETSKHYRDRFSGSFFLSHTYTLPFYPAGALRDMAYRRIGEFLTHIERLKLLSSEFQIENVTDAWWIGFTNENVDSFTEAVTLTEPRFLNQDDVLLKVANSKDLATQAELLKHIASLVDKLSSPPPKLAYQPKKYNKEIPHQWFWAAELLLIQHGLYASVTHVSSLAADAFLMHGQPSPASPPKHHARSPNT